MIETEGLTHIHLVVSDLARPLRFYQSAFGMEEMYRRRRASRRPRTARPGVPFAYIADPDGYLIEL